MKTNYGQGNVVSGCSKKLDSNNIASGTLQLLIALRTCFLFLINARQFVTAVRRSGARPVGWGVKGEGGSEARSGALRKRGSSGRRREECGRPSDAEHPSPSAGRISRPRIPIVFASFLHLATTFDTSTLCLVVMNGILKDLLGLLYFNFLFNSYLSDK